MVGCGGSPPVIGCCCAPIGCEGGVGGAVGIGHACCGYIGCAMIIGCTIGVGCAKVVGGGGGGCAVVVGGGCGGCAEVVCNQAVLAAMQSLPVRICRRNTHAK